MCAICGVIGRPHSPETVGVVRQMMHVLRHRGPDASGMVNRNTAVFGHQRLSIIDIAGGAQPLVSEDGRYALIFNGEIYNFKELSEMLIDRGITLRTKSDTEVLFKILIECGLDGLTKLDGMFAFAFHDAMTGDVLLARDPFGIKPLYYASLLSGGIIFASEIKALLCHPEIQASADRASIAQYLTFQCCLDDRTLFKGIKKLEPAGYVIVNGDAIKKTGKYWSPTIDVYADADADDVFEKVSSVLDESVRLQLQSDVKLGAYLSGGIDSSLVAALAAEKQDQSGHVFHGRFAESAAYDESHYAKACAQLIQAQYHEVTPTAEMFVKDMPAITYLLDEPLAGPGVFPQYRVSKLASEHVRVVLGGQGGDELFGGYARYLVAYFEQALKGAIHGTMSSEKHVVTLASIISNLPMLADYTPMLQTFFSDGLFGDKTRRYFDLIDRSPDFRALVEPGFLPDNHKNNAFDDFARVFELEPNAAYINQMLNFDIRVMLPALLHVEDRVSMGWSIESRVPFLTTKLYDVASSIPPLMKFGGGKAKSFLRKMSTHRLPAEVIARKDKMGFPVPLHEWSKGGVVRDFIGDTLNSSASRNRGLFKRSGIEQIIDGEARYGRQLWGALSLELWFQTFVDRNPVAP